MGRSAEELHEQYRIEVELADRLRHAHQDERRGLYTKVYNELYSRVPHHPGIARQRDPEIIAARVQEQLKPIKRYLAKDTVFLEVGAGDCRLALKVASMVNRVIVVEVSDEKALKHLELPDNLTSVLSDGVDFDVPCAGEVTLAFSNQVIEHLHPDDALYQLKAVYSAMAEGGIFVIRTPHLFIGPSDISKHFDTVPRGMHLKEYMLCELVSLLRHAGFRNVWKHFDLRGRSANLRVAPLIAVERLMHPLPHRFRRLLSRSLPLRPFISLCLVAQK